RPPRNPQTNPVLAFQEVRVGTIDLTPLTDRKVPRRLVAVCGKALAVDPAQRYRKAEEMAQELEQFAGPPRARRRLVMAAAGLAILACLVLGGFLLSGLFKSAPAPTDLNAAQPLALRHFSLEVLRDNKQLLPKTQEDLDQ